MIKQLCILAVVAVLASSQERDSALDIQWESYKEVHQKEYESASEELYRRLVWEDNVRYIQTHNKEADAGLHTYRLGLNELADMTNAEYRAKMLGFLMDSTDYGSSNEVDTSLKKVHLKDMPSSVDWRKKGYVTEVKNQKQCGSCWSFSATGSIEGQHFKATGKLVSLSEQNLVDCSKPEGNEGCGGGLMDQAFQYVIKNKGIDTEASYPYEARNDRCRYNPKNSGATISSFHDIPTRNESALAAAVAKIGPISVAIDAGHVSFQLYKSGVYNERLCSQTQLDHGVLAVGYGAVGDKKYWIVKNSWGGSWGMKGYIWMSRDKDNQCGIATQSSYPLV